MEHDALLIGEVAARSGVSRKALRLYEAAGILPVSRRTAAGYRLYGRETLALLDFVAKARRLGFTLDEIREIVAIKRAGGLPCLHVRDLVRRKLADVDRRLTDLKAVRDTLRALSQRRGDARQEAAVCPHIEGIRKENRDGRHQDVAMPGVHRLPRG